MGSTNAVQVGPVKIGGGAPVSIQSMTNTKTTCVEETLEQIHKLTFAGCELVRVAIPKENAIPSFEQICLRSAIPVIADIHFNAKLALAALDAGAAKIRINPGNIGKADAVRDIVKKAVSAQIPIRIGVNSGSLESDILKEQGGPTVQALVASAVRHIDRCRQWGAEQLVLSVKSSDVLTTIKSYEEVSRRTDVPLHIGVTEAGTLRSGSVKSAVALGILLYQGIGDTLRVSLTGDPVQEILVAKNILSGLHLKSGGVNLISCPTCSRTQVDLIPIAEAVETALAHLDFPITVAIMGCEVNGPGEAREADIGIACGRKRAVLFKRGTIIKRIDEKDIVSELVNRIENWSADEN